MKKLVVTLIMVFVLFTIINAYTAPINLLEFANDKNNFGIGIGIVELADEQRQAWDIFPLHFYLKSGDRNIFLLYNFLSVIFKTGTNYSKPINVAGTYTGDIVSVGGLVTVSGRVNGDIWTFNSDVILYQGSVVTGSIVSLGGHVYSYQPVYVDGTKLVVSDLQFPLMGIIVSPNASNVFQLFGFSLFSVLFYLLILFLYSIFGRGHLNNLTQAVSAEWKGSLLFTLIALLCIPLIVVLLIASKAGLMIVPFFLVFMMAAGYAGFVSVASRIGRLIIRGDGQNVAHAFFSGALGFVLVHGITIIGLILSLFNADFFKTLSSIFLTVGTIISYIVFIYGLGVSMARLKKAAT